MTPLETLGLAVSERLGGGRDWWRVIGSKRAIVDEIVEVAGRFRLTDVLDERTSNLPYGKQRLLEIAVAFACRPRVLLLDEPAAGVPEAERHELLATVAALPRDVSVLLIEHDMDLVFSFADRISVLVNGALLTEGSVEEVSTDPRVRAVYLGESVDELSSSTLRQVSAGYGEAVVISGIDLRLKQGEALAVLGRNGTGKTTLLNTIVGVTRHRGGTIALAGRDMTARAAGAAGATPASAGCRRSATSSGPSPSRRT